MQVGYLKSATFDKQLTISRVKLEILNLAYRLAIASPSLGMINFRPRKISLEWLKLETSNFVQWLAL